MEFNDIEFYEHEKYGIGRHLRGRWVGKTTLELMWRHASASMHKVDWSELQTTESLYGNAEWRDVKFGRRYSLGRCLRFFADEGVLPITLANKGKKGKRKYKRT
jgi:hypothetical protein